MSSPEETRGPKLLGHEYDGIQEYDNPMPKWWKWLFWGSFYFSLLYFAHYHLTGNGTSVERGYADEVSQAREAEAQALLQGGGPNEDKLREMMANDGLMSDAKPLFVAKCAQCHGNDGEGKIGPNLTDAYWLHGDASLMSLYTSVGEGFPQKGMPAWNRQLRLVEVMKLAAFVGSIKNKNLTGPRPPEGTELAGARTAPAESSKP